MGDVFSLTINGATAFDIGALYSNNTWRPLELIDLRTSLQATTFVQLEVGVLKIIKIYIKMTYFDRARWRTTSCKKKFRRSSILGGFIISAYSCLMKLCYSTLWACVAVQSVQ